MIRATLLTIALVIPLSATAQTQVPNEFQSGTPARAAEVNANFDTLETAIDSNAANIAANASDISAVAESVANLAADGAGLTVLFYNGDVNQDCQFHNVPSNRLFWWNSVSQRIESTVNGSSSYSVLYNVVTAETAKSALLDLMIRIGKLPLVVDDFRDATTGEFDCTNSKLLSLL